ncbi:hypothetical protein F2Q69_00023126 [Brassica cretica]|uniref:Uncharacterized protein n=1 Tax=Brassica cretica TaxID=69181 RepID=A0A8S9QFT3_BRACR|nr:hypothetical protein F2Q69_00023126 [Brassica cretica]
MAELVMRSIKLGHPPNWTGPARWVAELVMHSIQLDHPPSWTGPAQRMAEPVARSIQLGHPPIWTGPARRMAEMVARSVQLGHPSSWAVCFLVPGDPDGYGRAIDGHGLQRVTKEFYDTAGGVDNHFKQKYRHPTRPKFYCEEKDEYEVYRDIQGCARDVDGEIINVSKDDIRKLMERASRDEHCYICLPEHASSFTQTKMVPEIYRRTRSMRCSMESMEPKKRMKDMRQDIAKIQHAADKHRPASIDRYHSTSIDDDPKNSHSMKSQPDFHTRAKIDQLVEEIYRTLETTEETLDRRCDDIYFPMDPTMNALTSKIEAIQRELLEI